MPKRDYQHGAHILYELKANYLLCNTVSSKAENNLAIHVFQDGVYK
jgi:hypothetical protein